MLDQSHSFKRIFYTAVYDSVDKHSVLMNGRRWKSLKQYIPSQPHRTIKYPLMTILQRRCWWELSSNKSLVWLCIIYVFIYLFIKEISKIASLPFALLNKHAVGCNFIGSLLLFESLALKSNSLQHSSLALYTRESNIVSRAKVFFTDYFSIL